MKTTNYYKLNGQITTGALQRHNEKLCYIRERLNEYESGNPYPLAYMVANSTIKLLLQRQYTNTLKEIKDNLFQTYSILSNNNVGADYVPVNDKAADVLEQAVLFLAENNGYYTDSRKSLRHWISEQKNGWADTETVYYEDAMGDIHRVPKALTCAIDGMGSACTVSSYTVEEIAALLNKIPLSPTERKYLNLKLQGYTEKAIAERFGKALGTVSSTIATAKSKARYALTK